MRIIAIDYSSGIFSSIHILCIYVDMHFNISFSPYFIISPVMLSMPGALLFLIVFICSLTSSNIGCGKHISFSASMFSSPTSSAVSLFRTSEKYSTHLSVILPLPAIIFPSLSLQKLTLG
jgi:hypothetical protein